MRTRSKLAAFASVMLALSASSVTAETVRPSVDAPSAAKAALDAIARQYFPSQKAAIAPKRLIRLTRVQLDRTAAAVLPGYALPPVSKFVARDSLQTNYEFADLLAVNSANSPAFASWAAAVAAIVRTDPKPFLECSSSREPDCAAQRVKSFVTAAFRADAPRDRIDVYVARFVAAAKASTPADAAGEIVEIVLNSPHFLFRKETDVDRYGRLAPAQLLQAVTYTLADAPPEAFGLDSSRATEFIGDGRAAAATIRTIAASPDARAKLVRFIAAWLELRNPDEFTISRATFPEFTPEIAASVHSDALALLRDNLGGDTPSLKTITQSTATVVSQSTAALVGATKSSGPSSKISTDIAQRLGIFTNPAFIASHSGPTDERPIKRGVFWVRKAMCMELEPPPKDLHAKLYDLKGATQRQRIEQSTEGAACIGCHKVINPFAFFMESYDALGRWRTSDNGQPIDTSVIIDFLDDEPQETRTAVEAIKALTSSEMFKQCFVRQMFRFYLARKEDAGDDPALRAMFLTFSEGDRQDILAALRALVSSDRIVQRGR